MTILDDALAIAARLIPGAPVTMGAIEAAQRIGSALEQLSEAEQRIVTANAQLTELSSLGIAVKDDFSAYDTVRANLFDSEMGLFGAIRDAVQQVDPQALSQIPAPSIAPGVRRPRKMPKLADPGAYPAFLSFGSPGRVKTTAGVQSGIEAGAQAGLGVWQLWALAVIGVLGALALYAAVAYFIITEGAGLIAHIAATLEQTKQLESMYAARLQCFRQCLGTEPPTPQTRAACMETCGLLIPTPEEALPELEPPGQRREINWFLWGGLTVALLVGGYFAYRSDWGQRLFRRRQLGKPARRRAGIRGPRRVRDLDGPSTYNLEVQR